MPNAAGYADLYDLPRPLRDARLRYESPSRFTATVVHADGRSTVFVLQRQGLRWRLVDVRLPPDLSVLLR